MVLCYQAHIRSTGSCNLICSSVASQDWGPDVRSEKLLWSCTSIFINGCSCRVFSERNLHVNTRNAFLHQIKSPFISAFCFHQRLARCLGSPKHLASTDYLFKTALVYHYILAFLNFLGDWFWWSHPILQTVAIIV